MTDYVPAQTSVPDWLMTYCRQLADVHHGRRLNRMYEVMLEGFLKIEPWKSSPPLEWKMARIHGSSGMRNRKGADLGWVPMNMMLPVDLMERIRQTIEIININMTEGRELSLRTFLFTAVYWWCTYVYPYQGPGLLPE